MAEKLEPVIVYVTGGVVQHVHNPTDRVVEIIDYDVDGDPDACDCRDFRDVDAPHYHAG